MVQNIYSFRILKQRRQRRLLTFSIDQKNYQGIMRIKLFMEILKEIIIQNNKDNEVPKALLAKNTTLTIMPTNIQQK